MIMKLFERIGCQRAAAELRRMGYEKYAQNLISQCSK